MTRIYLVILLLRHFLKYLPIRLVLNTKLGSSRDHPYLFRSLILTSYSELGIRCVNCQVPSANGPVRETEWNLFPPSLAVFVAEEMLRGVSEESEPEDPPG